MSGSARKMASCAIAREQELSQTLRSAHIGVRSIEAESNKAAERNRMFIA